MNVRITPRHQPQRTDLYSGIVRVVSDGQDLVLWRRVGMVDQAIAIALPLQRVAALALDDEPGDIG